MCERARRRRAWSIETVKWCDIVNKKMKGGKNMYTFYAKRVPDAYKHVPDLTSTSHGGGEGVRTRAGRA